MSTEARWASDSNVAMSFPISWSRADDITLWRMLGGLFADHPNWLDPQCREIVRALIHFRRDNQWRCDLNHFWQRWKNHHRDLSMGLAHAGKLTWQQKCRYCEIWSANRPIMSPFSGVAEILLAISEKGLARPISWRINSHYSETSKDKVFRKEIIVVTTPATLQEFNAIGASRQLLWALRNSGHPWSLRQPWDENLKLDPCTIAGVIFWSYRHRSQDFVYHALGLEETCYAYQIPVINSIARGWDVRHFATLKKWNEAGVCCPKFQHFTEVNEIVLQYPLILRIDGVHRGKQMFLVKNYDEAQSLVCQKRIEFLASAQRQRATSSADGWDANKGGRVLPPPNLAIEFIDVVNEQGNYEKTRALIVGDMIIPRHHLTSKHWLVNFDSAESKEVVANQPVSSAQDNPSLILQAANASGSDVTALDYSMTRDGKYVFWEANRLFGMSGDDLSWISERRDAKDRKLGESLLAIIQDKLDCQWNHAPTPALDSS